MGVRPHVVIVGAGFGGLAAADRLARQPVDVTVVDQRNFTTFQPLLYQVGTAGLNAADVAHPIRGMFHRHGNVTFRLGRVTGVDWDGRTIVVDRPEAEPEHLSFDHLILAAGAVATWFGVTGAAEHALPLYTLDDAVAARNHVIERFEAADANPAEVDRGALTFVIVGGGPTGVETAGALAELFAMVFRNDYPQLPVTRARVVLVETLDNLLNGFAPSSQRHALATLRSRGIEVRLGTTVKETTPHEVVLAPRPGTDGAGGDGSGGDGSGEGGSAGVTETLATQTVVWAAGVEAHPLAKVLGLETGRKGRVRVAPDLSVPGRPGVWAIGDIAAVPGRDGDPLPQLAPVAMQSGEHVARQIGRVAEGKGTQPFRFFDRGTMATIGRRSAVAELPGRIRLHGTPAWLAWLALHLMYLAGLRNRASVLLNWAWSYLTWDRGPRIILGPDTPARSPRRPREPVDAP